MNKSHPLDKFVQKLNKQLASRNRKWLERVMEEVAEQTKIDVDQLFELAESQTPDIENIARELAAEATFQSILDDAALKPISESAFTDVMDECLRQTFTQLDFAEVFLDNFETAMSANSVAPKLTERMNAFATQAELSNVIEEYMLQLSEQIDVSEEIGEDFRTISDRMEIADSIAGFLKTSAAKTDFSSLFSERCSKMALNTEVLESLDHLVEDLYSRKDLSLVDSSLGTELRKSHQDLLEKLCQDIERETYRQLPWDQFLNLTYGSLADDPIERPQTLEPDSTDSLS